MAHTVDIIEDLINELDFTYDVTSNTNDSTDTTLVVKNTFHSRAGLLVTDGSTDYTIKSVDHGTRTIVLSGVASGSLSLQNPFYFHGVPYKVNEELSSYAHSDDKFPLIYLYEIIREREILDPESAIEKESDIRLFFLDECNFAEWDTDQHYNLAITPMKNLLSLFIDNLKNNSKIGELTDMVTIPHANFGVFTDNAGHTNSIFNDHTSGMELQITLPILHIEECI